MYKILGLGKKQLFVISSNTRIVVAGVGASNKTSLWLVRSKHKEICWMVQMQPEVKLWDCHGMYSQQLIQVEGRSSEKEKTKH